MADRWLASRTKVGSDQSSRYRGTLKNHSFESFHAMDIADIGPNDIAAWVLAQLKAGVSAKTIANKHCILFGIFKYARTRG